MLEGGKSGHEIFYTNPKFAEEMGRKPEKPEFNLPKLDDEELGYDPEEPTVETEMPLGQKAGEIVSDDGVGEKTRVIPAVHVDLGTKGGDKTKIIDRRMGGSNDVTQFMDLTSADERQGKDDKTVIVGRPKKKN